MNEDLCNETLLSPHFDNVKVNCSEKPNMGTSNVPQYSKTHKILVTMLINLSFICLVGKMIFFENIFAFSVTNF